jgi:CRISPR/Cas system CSM-associated protein Csm2 small subunit
VVQNSIRELNRKYCAKEYVTSLDKITDGVNVINIKKTNLKDLFTPFLNTHNRTKINIKSVTIQRNFSKPYIKSVHQRKVNKTTIYFDNIVYVI